MESGAVNKTLSNYSHDQNVERSQGDMLNLSFWEDSEWADPVVQNLGEYSRCADEIKDNLWENSQWLDKVRQNLWELCEWADDISDSLLRAFQDHKMKLSSEEDLTKDFQDQKMKMPRVEDMSNSLPEELVERILARVPFPFVFKARVLSKSWLARLSSISSQDDEEKKLLAISFQKQICEQSVNWKVFFPVYTQNYCPCYDYPFYHDTSRTVMNAIDKKSHTLLRLPLLSDLFKNLLDSRTPSFLIELIEGPLLLLSMERSGLSLSRVREKDLYVANILTGDWKELPPYPCPWMYGRRCHLSITSDKYELVIYGHHFSEYVFQGEVVSIYDSTTGAWTSVKISSPRSRKTLNHLANPAYLNRVLYFVTLPDQDALNSSTLSSLEVLAVNLNAETLAEQVNVVAVITGIIWRGFPHIGVIICPVNLLIIIVQTRGYDETLLVKIDLQSGQISVVDPSRPDTAREAWVEEAVAYRPRSISMNCVSAEPLPDGDQALLGKVPARRILSSFRPGLNPFVAV